MKKMVVLSLLVLNFPLVAFADTSESIPDKTVSSSQEQVIDSASLSEEPFIEDPVSDTPSSVEESVENQDTTNTEAEITNQSKKTVAETETTTSKPKKVADTVTSEALEEKSATKNSSTKQVKVIQAPVAAEEKIINEWTANDIRKNLTGADYGINQTELNGYTDQELTNAFRLFTRYNFDVTGMDLGSYVRVLRMVYHDQSISWADAEKALAFNPNIYTTTTELANNIDQLQAYLRILYSSKEGFLPLRHFTNEEMLHILDHLSGAENELSAANGLFSGLVHWLYNSQKGNGPIENSPKPGSPIQNMGTTTTVENTAVVPAANTTKNEVQAQSAGQKEYPKTGESRNLVFTFTGIALFIITGIVILKRRVHS